MKSYLIAAISKFCLGALFFFAVSTVRAQSGGVTTKEEPVTVKYLGAQDDMVVFNVSCPNPSGNRFSLIVKDQDGNPLYQGTFAEKAFYKQFRLSKADRSRITFLVRTNREADVIKSFEINVNSRFVADVDIKKLN
jgi:hypothetical protein